MRKWATLCHIILVVPCSTDFNNSTVHRHGMKGLNKPAGQTHQGTFNKISPTCHMPYAICHIRTLQCQYTRIFVIFPQQNCLQLLIYGRCLVTMYEHSEHFSWTGGRSWSWHTVESFLVFPEGSYTSPAKAFLVAAFHTM
jgi:hypothetical protein